MRTFARLVLVAALAAAASGTTTAHADMCTPWVPDPTGVRVCTTGEQDPWREPLCVYPYHLGSWGSICGA